MRKWLYIAATLLLAAYLALPWYSASQLAATAHRQELARFRAYVDLPAVRANLKRDLQQRLRESMGPEVPGDLNDFIAAGANLLLGPLLQGLVTAEGLAALLRGGDALWQFEQELEAAGRRGAADGRQPPANSGHLHLRRWGFTGLNRVAADYGSGEHTELRLILQRQGLHWRVVELRFPGEPQTIEPGHRGISDENG